MGFLKVYGLFVSGPLLLSLLAILEVALLVGRDSSLGCSACLLASLPAIPGSSKICGWRFIWLVGLANMDPSWSNIKRILIQHEEMAEAKSYGLQQVRVNWGIWINL